VAGGQHLSPGAWRAALECVLYVVYACSCVGGEDAYHVEAQGVEVWLVFGQVLFGEGADGGLLAGRYGFERVAEVCRAAELYLYEDEYLFVADYEIYFAATLPVVAFDQLKTALEEVAEREILAPRSGSLACQSPTPA
jgi:hypothetical protein